MGPREIMRRDLIECMARWGEAEAVLDALEVASDATSVRELAERLASIEIELTGDAEATTEAVRLAAERIGELELRAWAAEAYGV